MSEVLTILRSTAEDTSNALRERTGKTGLFSSAQWAEEIRAIGGIEPIDIEWVQAPDLSRQFIDNTSYNEADRTYTNIDNYAPTTAAAANYKPNGQSVAFKSGTLLMDGKRESVSEGNKTITNLVPGEHPFVVVGNDGDIIQAGILHPTHPLRWIDCPQAQNVRDIGGYSCDGGTVKYGKIIRGGKITSDDKPVLADQCGVTAELDLRANGDVTPPLYDGIVYCRPAGSLQYIFDDKETWKEVLEFVFDAVAKNSTIYIHCSRGADRTGTVMLVLEALLGMSMSDIDKDYELSRFYLGSAGDMRRTKPNWVNLIGKFDALTVGTTFREKVINWVGSLGIPVKKLNRFIAAAVDGTPTPVTYDFGIVNVINELTELRSDNSVEVIPKYQSYHAELTPSIDGKYVSHEITIGGVVVTEEFSRIKYKKFSESMETDYTIEIDIPWGRLTGDLVIRAEAEIPKTGYTLLEYAAVTVPISVQGIVDLGYVNTANTGYSLTFEHAFVNDGAWYYRGIFGNNDLAFGTQRDFRGYKGANKSFALGISSATGGWHTVCVNFAGNGECTVDGADKGWNGGAGPSHFNETLKVFSAGTHSAFTAGDAIRIKVEEILIAESGTLVKTYRPARREDDGNVGFLEIETDTFWPSVGEVYDPAGFESVIAVMTLEYEEGVGDELDDMMMV